MSRQIFAAFASSVSLALAITRSSRPAWAAGICPLLGPWRLGAVQLVYGESTVDVTMSDVDALVATLGDLQDQIDNMQVLCPGLGKDPCLFGRIVAINRRAVHIAFGEPHVYIETNVRAALIHDFFAEEDVEEAEREAFAAAYSYLAAKPDAAIYYYSK